MGKGVYKFEFKDKSPIFIAWQDKEGFLDLSSEISSKKVKITHIPKREPPQEEIALVNKISVNSSPIFVEI